jgi:hypothetical protein
MARVVQYASDPARTNAMCVKAQAKYTAGIELASSFRDSDPVELYTQVRISEKKRRSEGCKHSHSTSTMHSLPNGPDSVTDDPQIVIIPSFLHFSNKSIHDNFLLSKRGRNTDHIATWWGFRVWGK